MDFLYADLNEIVDPFAYSIKESDGTAKLEIDNDKRTLSAKVLFTPGTLTVKTKHEDIAFNGQINKTIEIPEYRIQKEDAGEDIRARYALYKYNYSTNTYEKVEGELIELEEQLDELNIENGAEEDTESTKIGNGNAGITSVHYVHEKGPVFIYKMFGANTKEDKYALNITGLNTKQTLHGGTQTGIQSVAFGGQAYNLSNVAAIVFSGLEELEGTKNYFDIKNEYPLTLQRIGDDKDTAVEKPQGMITIPISYKRSCTFLISRDERGKVVELFPQVEIEGLKISIVRGFDQKTTAKGNQSFSMGGGTQANSDYSQAFGLGTITSGHGQMVIGTFNEEVPDALFIVGNGWYDYSTGKIHRSNAFVIMRDGTIKTYDKDTTDDYNPDELVTRAQLDKLDYGYIDQMQLK